MVQAIRDFGEGLRKGLGIVVECRSCGKRVKYRCSDFQGYIAHGANIEDLTWRCTWCRTPSQHVRYTLIDPNNRESLAQWTPPAWLRRR